MADEARERKTAIWLLQAQIRVLPTETIQAMSEQIAETFPELMSSMNTQSGLTSDRDFFNN